MPLEPDSNRPEIELVYGPALAAGELIELLGKTGLRLRQIEGPEDLQDLKPALLLLDEALLQRYPPEIWRFQLAEDNADCLILAEIGTAEGVDLVMPPGQSAADSAKIVQLALKRWVIQRENQQLRDLLMKTEQDLQLLTSIGIALSAEKDLDRLLDKILSEAQKLACCDAASLFLVEKQEGAAPVLTFKLTRNDSIEADFHEQRMELDRRSIAGFVTVADQELNISNAYEISTSEPYSFNRGIDKKMGYRTVSMLTLPMRNYRAEVIGVLQFINRKTSRGVVLDSDEVSLAETLPFHEEQVGILRALASQSAVAIENSVLLENINDLFSGFVQAAVAAIEQRDPTTSGHSFRVADLCVDLATRLPEAKLPGYSDIHFREAEIKELRYAALLHDFGKVGVREHVLTKAKKLPQGQFEMIRYRIRLVQESLRRQTSDQLLQAWRDNSDPAHIRTLEEATVMELERLERFLQAVTQANEPTVLESGAFEHLLELRQYPFNFRDEGLEHLISEDEFQRLSIRRGSLSEAERAEIESHVVHTANFLRLIPWTPELARIPELAEAHHEKLDGSGYPFGMRTEEIPVGSKLMTVCDIYDALTASDRPYKSAVTRDAAYTILLAEAASGKLDTALVKLFIDAEVHRVLEGKDYASTGGGTQGNHPCAPDLHVP